jgi:hypothetical protein
MKFAPWMSAAAVATMALGLFCFGPSPVAAEEQVSPHSVMTDWGSYRYRTFQYPSRNTGFFMYPNSYVTFDIVNGKYWQLEHPRAELELKPTSNPEHVFPPIVQSVSPLRYEQFRVTLFTPDMHVLGVFDKVRQRHIYNIPKDGNDYERLICRIECEGEDNFDIKMRVLDAVDPVMAEPMPNERFRF